MGDAVLERGAVENLHGARMVIIPEKNKPGADGAYNKAHLPGYIYVAPPNGHANPSNHAKKPFPDTCTIESVLSERDVEFEKHLRRLVGRTVPDWSMLAGASCSGKCEYRSSFGGVSVCSNPYVIAWYSAEREKEAELAKQKP